MKRKSIIIISAVILAIVLVWVFFFRKKTPPIVLQTEKPRYGYISESVTATGTIQPVDTVAVGTQISGTIYRLHAGMNDEVKKGQLLAEIDPILVQATLDQANAVLAQNRSNQALQQKNFNRQKQLYEVGAISKADYDASLNAINAANAIVSNAAAQVKSASKNVSLTKIYSPIDGVILTRNISIGQTVAASFSTPTLFSIAKDLTNMQVRANVDEADIADLDTTLRATFTVDAYLNKEFDGKIREISLQPTVVSNVVTYPTFIGTTNLDKKLKPGMTANIIIYTHEADSAMLIPVKATKFRPDSALEKKYTIVRRQRGDSTAGTRPKGGKSGSDNAHASVWVLQGKEIVQKRIKTGLNNNIDIQVLQGLSADDIVIIGATGGKIGAKTAGSSASPFMPARRGGGQRGGGGGPRG
ncbi:MAG: efflux transporter, family, subunit [Flavipsychrobacter sp.]|nr:efflux transporter, family, subunit [Flavipsychrobacter sp.]